MKIFRALVVLACLGVLGIPSRAAEQSSNPSSSTGVVQAGAGAATKRSAPGDIQRTDVFELPPILIIASVNPQAKSDPEAQKLLDKALADLQVIQQDEAARNTAFGQFVLAERSGGADAIQNAHKELNSANVKLLADARQFHQQDVIALRKRVHELVSRGSSAPETGARPGNAGKSPATAPAPASTN